MIVGRYQDGGNAHFSISGTLLDKPVSYSCAVDLPRGSADSANEFLAPLWAARQIGYLLQEIRLHGENKELIEEVVRLSKQYGIVTEYTEFLASGGVALSKDEVLTRAKGSMAAARSQQAGQWAVNQAPNDRAMQQRAVATNEANVYRDRRGNVMTAQNISQVGRRAFYLQDGQWVDSEEAGTRPDARRQAVQQGVFRPASGRPGVRPGASNLAGPCRSTSARNASSSRKTASKKMKHCGAGPAAAG